MLRGLIWARETFAEERSRWALWLPVWFGTGIVVYFRLPEEPAWWIGSAALLIALAATVAARRHTALQIVAWCAVVIAAGVTVAQMRTSWVEAPVLAKRTAPVWVEGRVLRVDQRPDARRIWLDRLNISRLIPSATPERIRLRIRNGVPALAPGDAVALRAVLYPPPGPAAPGAFNFARRAYFQRLGAVGYGVSKVRRTATDDGSIVIAVAGLRHAITRRVREALPGTAGTVAAALMTGERGAIPEHVLEAMRESGLAHLLAISGLHIGLVAGILFFVIRFGLAGCERLALHHPIKKWAAFIAMIGAFGYLVLSGMTVPTQRAFLMLLLMLVAVVLDRNPISMRLVAWAAVAVLLIAPESVLSVSFQMSFAAVVALIAVYEASVARATLLNRERLPRAVVYLGGVMLSTVVAGLATAPFAIYHFNRVALYGVAANLVAIPLTGMWIMPWALAAFVLLPFGLERLALAPMGWGIDGLIAVATFVQGLPGSVALLPAMPSWGLALVAAGGLWLCLWQRPWRALGLVPVAAGMLAVALVRPPDVLVDGAAKVMAVRGGDGTVALVTHRAALAEDCAVATVLISRVPVSTRACPGPLAVIDRFKLWREGPHALWLTPGAVRIESVGRAVGRRPWSMQQRRQRKRR